MFGHRPGVAVVVGVNLDDIPIGVRVMNGCSEAMVRGPLRQDAQTLQARIGAEQIVERLALESNVLQ